MTSISSTRLYLLNQAAFGRSEISSLVSSFVLSLLFHVLILEAIDSLVTTENNQVIHHVSGTAPTIQLRFVDPALSSPEVIQETSDQRSTTLEASASKPIPDNDAQEEKPYTTKNANPKQAKNSESKASVLPIPIIGISPRYPLHLLSKNIRGSVTATFQVGNGGIFENIRIIESTPVGIFDRPVVEAISSAKMVEGFPPLGTKLMITVIFDPSGMTPPPQLSIHP